MSLREPYPLSGPWADNQWTSKRRNDGDAMQVFFRATKFVRLLASGAFALLLIAAGLVPANAASMYPSPGDTGQGRTELVSLGLGQYSFPSMPSEVASEDPGPILISSLRRIRTFNFPLAVPRHSTATRSADGGLTIKSAGQTVLELEPAWAMDDSGSFLRTDYQYINGRIRQTVRFDSSTNFPVLVDPTTRQGAMGADNAAQKALPTAPGASQQHGAGAQIASFSTQIGVPGSYVYKPSLGALHDYCTKSPDSYFRANFRGPCARHDMCYEALCRRDAGCDKGLWATLTYNCVAAYGTWSPQRYACAAVAKTYYDVVRIVTSFPG